MCSAYSAGTVPTGAGECSSPKRDHHCSIDIVTGDPDGATYDTVAAVDDQPDHAKVQQGVQGDC